MKIFSRICLYQLLALLDNSVYITVFKTGHVMYSGYVPGCDNKYLKYPVVHFRVLTDNHLMIHIV